MIYEIMNELWIEYASKKFIQDNDNVVDAVSLVDSKISKENNDPIIYLRDRNTDLLAIYQAWNNDYLVRLDVPSEGITVL